MMVMEPAEKDIEVMRSFIGRKRRERSEHLAKRLEKARGDFALILDLTVREFDPLRVYQWGSLLEGRHFQEISDIDMAVEGITDPETFSRLCARAEEMTSLPLHIVQIVRAYIEQALKVLSGLVESLDSFDTEVVPKIGRTKHSVLIPAQILENGYTAAETLFMRISQAFENHLAADRWHSDLLEKMTLEIEGTRPRVISGETYTRLNELMRFRHFKRYYFEMDYDWRKIDLLVLLFREAVPLLAADLAAFSEKLKRVLG